MIDREDGPVKHYRIVCNTCKKQTKRFAYEPPYFGDKEWPTGWKEVKDDGWYGNKHYCPKCASNTVDKTVKEIVPNIGDGDDISDHDAAHRPLIREAVNKLVIDLQDGCKWVITSDTPIKVEQHEE
jgi:hypothetical protein